MVLSLDLNKGEIRKPEITITLNARYYIEFKKITGSEQRGGNKVLGRIHSVREYKSGWYLLFEFCS
jgi:hypothetical protein